MDKKTEEQLLRWFEEEESDTVVDDEDIDSCSDESEDGNEEGVIDQDGNQEADIEQSDISEDENIIEDMETDVSSLPSTSFQNSEPIFLGKDKTKWLKHKPSNTQKKVAKKNIIKSRAGVRGLAKERDNILDCWKLFFPDDTINRLVIYTNIKLAKMRDIFKNVRFYNDCDFEEMNAFIGLLYLAGVKKAQHLNTSELWLQDGTAPEYFCATMSEKRFHILIRAIRFDDINTRPDRSKYDNLAPIRELFEEKYYTIGSYATIDEMLEAFRGKCKFRQYIANKPAKYGIKIYALVDALSFYVNNMEIYCGKQPAGPFTLPNDAANVVKRMIKTIDKSGRNVTMDNYFSSVALANDLLQNHGLTMVGTLRKNKRELPLEFLNIKKRPLCSSVFGYGASATNSSLILSYIPKRNKNVIMLSTFHDDDAIDSATKEAFKPEVITFYNQTKGGVDVVDRLKSEYNTTRISNRWPFTIFCSLLNIATVNSQIIHKTNTNKLQTRRKFITQLAKILTKPHLERRLNVPTLTLRLRNKISFILKKKPVRLTVSGAASGPPEGHKPRCAFCPARKNRYTNRKCELCDCFICGEHIAKPKIVCINCHETNMSDSD